MPWATGVFLAEAPRRLRPLLVGVLLILLRGAALEAQGRAPVTDEFLLAVMPDAERFSERAGDPPVWRGYRGEESSGDERLVGYVFVTSDLPPEVVGYLGPIDVLVGLDPGGVITGVRVLWHREPLAHSRRDFLEDPRFLGQFAGKHVGEAFRLRTDVRGISGATVSVAALALGIRNASRRVALAHATGASGSEGLGRTGAVEQEDSIRAGPGWFDVLEAGLLQRITGEVDGMARIDIFFGDLASPELGELLLGPDVLARAREAAGNRLEAAHPFFLGLDGPNLAWFRPDLFFVVQGGDTLRVQSDDVFLFDRLRSGLVVDQVGSAGLWLVDRRVDLSKPFSVGFGGDVGLAISMVEYSPVAAGSAPEVGSQGEDRLGSEGPGPVAVEVEPEDEAVSSGQGETPALGGQEARGSDTVAGRAQDPRAELAEGPSPPGIEGEEAETELLREIASSQLDLQHEENESQFARMLARTSWARVGGLLALLTLASMALLTRRDGLRWATLVGTLFFLGFWDRGFLSVSHISSAIVVGPGLFVSDLSLLIMVVFTVVTTLLLGRVFCGYLCPFGVIQDVIDRVVPDRIKVRPSPSFHAWGIKVKYVILGCVLAPALLEAVAPHMVNQSFSIYHYVEPFGTVFFFSTSKILWAIAITILIASAVIPRFYCRYVCPLGAALAVGSRVAPFRIRRVEQCGLCKVCEKHCPTGAIRMAEVDFPECVRCSVCEVKLKEKAGTCRHDMETIRPRLVQLRAASSGGK